MEKCEKCNVKLREVKSRYSKEWTKLVSCPKCHTVYDIR